MAEDLTQDPYRCDNRMTGRFLFMTPKEQAERRPEQAIINIEVVEVEPDRACDVCPVDPDEVI